MASTTATSTYTQRLNRLINLMTPYYNSHETAAKAVQSYAANNQNSPGLRKALLSGHTKDLIDELKVLHNGELPNQRVKDTYARGLGSFKEGFTRAFDRALGYVDTRAPMMSDEDGLAFPVMEGGKVNYYRPMDVHRRPQYADHAWDVSAEGADYNTAENLLFRTGAVAGDLVGNGTRHIFWNIHPNEVTQHMGGALTLGSPSKGLPQPEAYQSVSSPGNSPRVAKGSSEAAALRALGGFLAVEGLNIGSGNYDPFNPTEGFRSAGYSALSPEEGGDQRKPTNPAMDVIERHFLGRKGRILPWEQFTAERPDVSYEKYKQYRDWQYGKADDPVRDLSLGLVKFTPSNLDNAPEINMMGTSITPTGVLAAAAGVIAPRTANYELGGRAWDEYATLMRKSQTSALSDDELSTLLRNPFAKAAERDEVRAAQYHSMVKNDIDRW